MWQKVVLIEWILWSIKECVLGINVYIFSKLWCAMSRGKEMPITQMKWHLDAQTTFEVGELETNKQGLTNYECPCN